MRIYKRKTNRNTSSSSQDNLGQCFLTFFFIFTLLTKVVTRFTLNILNDAHLLKNEISKLLQLYLFNVTAALFSWQQAVQCLVK